MKKLIFIMMFLASASVFGADYSDDILLVSVGESSDRYSEVAVHLQALLANTAEFADSTVTIVEDSTIESLADGYYDKNSADTTLRSTVALGYRYVILIPTIITTPNGTIEYTEYNGGPTDVYDDAPLDNEYFAPEVFYEGCTQLSKLILNAGSTPLVFLPDNADEDLADFGPVMYRVANGVGMQLIPGAYALDSAGETTEAEAQYLYACSIFSKITGLNASTANYTPSDIASADAVALADTAESTVILHNSTTHYEGSYENDGAVVYRSLDVSSEPFNNVVRYMYKGSSTHDWTSDALTLMISSNSVTTKAARKLGTLNGFSTTGVRYWHPYDITDQGYKFALEPNEAQFMYVSGSWEGADAQDCIDLTQTNMVPMAFDWIKSFAIGGETGTDATLDALDYHDCNELYFNYAERGWKLIPLTIGMGRLNEAVEDFSASDDGLHCSDLLVYMNAYMMLSSALGAPFPFPEEIPAEEIHRGSHTTEEILAACLIGHEIITELAFLSETSASVPDGDLTILTESLTEIPLNELYTYTLSATGGDGVYSWEVVSSAGLPEGLVLSSDGVLSGTLETGVGTLGVGFKVTDETGAFRKVGLKLSTSLPVGDITSSVDVVSETSNDYGTDTVAVMYSAVQTAPDQLATFRIAVSVDPMDGTSITSAGGLWGINSGEAADGWWNTFDGSLTQSVDSVSTIQIVDFDANGGDLTTNDFTHLSFESVTVYNANNASDRVKVVAGGMTNATGGLKLDASPAIIDLQTLAESTAVSSFTLANGNLGNDKDRWNIGSVQVEYTISMPSDDNYDSWASGYGLSGDDAALLSSDLENGGVGDGYNNLAEFALGMNPTESDAGSMESLSTVVDGGTNYFEYVHYRRSDYISQGLTYLLIDSTNLVDSILSTNTQAHIITGSAVDGYESVTNRYLIDGPAKFIRLKIGKD
jgi:hypothetical protein